MAYGFNSHHQHLEVFMGKIVYNRIKCKNCGNKTMPDRPCMYCGYPVKEEKYEYPRNK